MYRAGRGLFMEKVWVGCGLVPRFSRSEGSHLRWYDIPKEGSHWVTSFRNAWVYLAGLSQTLRP